MIRGMMVLLKYSVSIAYLFGVSHEHVRRWLKGENLPHPAMRKHVVDAFDAILAAHYEARIWKASVAGEESTYANDVRALIDELDSVKDPHASFTELYSRGVYLLHYDDKEAARAFDTSITNVSRYRRGGGAPAAAKIILRHLRTLLENAMGDE
jgi:transcriptional regulator with XRE-family HTH domain